MADLVMAKMQWAIPKTMSGFVETKSDPSSSVYSDHNVYNTKQIL